MRHYESLNRLKDLFRELFQLDTADLDFGLYHLFRLKRTEIEAFLDKQLPAEVDLAFKAATAEERDNLQNQVEQLAKQALKSVADDAILPERRAQPQARRDQGGQGVCRGAKAVDGDGGLRGAAGRGLQSSLCLLLALL